MNVADKVIKSAFESDEVFQKKHFPLLLRKTLT